MLEVIHKLARNPICKADGKLVRRPEHKPAAAATTKALLADIRELIHATRDNAARSVNSALVILYWEIGTRIRHDVLKSQRADYGEKIVHTLSAQLTVEFGSGFTKRNLDNMIRFAEAFPHPKIVHTLCAQLSWSHFRQIIYLDDPNQRDFYAEMSRMENWSVRALGKKIQSMLYERTALSRKPEKLIAREIKTLRKEDKLTPDLVFRDPYILDLFGLKDAHSEKDLENAILRDMESNKLLPKRALEKRLRDSLLRARRRLENQPAPEPGISMLAAKSKTRLLNNS